MTCGDNVDRLVLSVIQRERERSVAAWRGEEPLAGGHNIRCNFLSQSGLYLPCWSQYVLYRSGANRIFRENKRDFWVTRRLWVQFLGPKVFLCIDLHDSLLCQCGFSPGSKVS